MRVKIFKFVVVVYSMFGSTNLLAEQGKPSQEDAIPFAVYSQPFAISTYQTLTSGSTADRSPMFKDIPTKDLAGFLKTIRTTICQSAGDADVRVWISTDVNAKLLVVSAAAQSGLEVTLHCKEK